MRRDQTEGVLRHLDDLRNMAGDDHPAQDLQGRLAGMPSLSRANAMFSAKESESTSSLLVLSSCGTRHPRELRLVGDGHIPISHTRLRSTFGNATVKAVLWC